MRAFAISLTRYVRATYEGANDDVVAALASCLVLVGPSRGMDDLVRGCPAAEGAARSY